MAAYTIDIFFYTSLYRICFLCPLLKNVINAAGLFLLSVLSSGI
jgi:hypothetical protein